MAEEAEINVDGTTTIETPSVVEDTNSMLDLENVEQIGFDSPSIVAMVIERAIHPAVFIVAAILLLLVIAYRSFFKRKKAESFGSSKISKRIASMSHDCIECDACGRPNPQQQCSTCHTAYYCSSICQTRHLLQHLPYCHSIEKMRQAMLPGLLMTTESEDAFNAECGICLEEPIRNPIVLKDCKHAFCSSCLLQWQRHVQSPLSIQDETCCPLCPTKTKEDAETAIMDRALLLAGRANRASLSDAEKKVYRDEALAELEKVLELEEPHLQALFSKAQILLALEQPTKAIETTNELMELNEQREEYVRRLETLMEQQDRAMAAGNEEEALRIQQVTVDMVEREGMPATRLSGGKLKFFDMKMLQASAHQQLKEWRRSIAIYKSLFELADGPGDLSPVQQRQLFMGLARCFYEVGDYERAISLSDAAIEMNRHFPGVHKYKALSFKAQGDIDQAVTTMHQAVLYETPWDDENRAKALELYDELCVEKAAGG